MSIPASEPIRPTHSLQYWKWRILFATMACYLFYYCGRFNLSVCMKPISDEFGWDKAQMGLLVSVYIWTYGLGQLLNGNLTDRVGRVLMPIGAVMSCVANWMFSFTPTIGKGMATLFGMTEFTGMVLMTMGIVWAVNAYFQAMGMAPGGRLISNWWPDEERGRAMGFYTFSSAMANVTVFVLASLAAEHWGWRAAFRYPVLIMAVVSVLFYLVTKDHPEQVGLESPHKRDETKKARGGFQRYLAAFGNARFLLACCSIGLHHIARWGLLTFIPIFFMETCGWKIKDAGFVAAALPLGMAAGALSGGYISDRFFAGKRATVIAGSLFLCAACVLVLPMIGQKSVAAENTATGAASTTETTVAKEVVPKPELSRGAQLIAAAMLVVSGYMLYLCIGPYFSLPADLLGTEMAGTGIGALNAAAYAGAGIGTFIVGILIKYYGYTSGFQFMAACAVAGGITICFVRR